MTRTVALAAACALATSIAACGNSSSGPKTTSGSTTGQAAATSNAAPVGSPPVEHVNNDWALRYTGGTAGKADPSKSPVVVGYINQEGGVPSFPEATVGMNAAAQYVNSELGGVQGHPVRIEKCAVQTEEDGQKCATQMANDPRVKFVIEGQLAVGTKAVVSVLAGKKPMIESSPSTIDDLTDPDAYAYTPGGPGVIAGLAIFTAKYLKGVTTVGVVHGDNPAATQSAQQFFKPLIQKLGVKDVKLVAVSDSATGPDLASGIQAAGGQNANALEVFLTVPGCIATYDGLRSLGINPTVVATGLCFGTPMTKHLHDLGMNDPVPNGWYFGAFGYSYFQPDAASGMKTYLAKIRQYGPPNVEYTGFAGYLWGDLLTAVKFVNHIGVAHLTPASFRHAAKTFRGPMALVAGPMRCGYSKLFPALCGSQVGIEQYKNGHWLPSALATNGHAISVAQVLGG